MAYFEHPEFDGHQQTLFCHDVASGLRAIIAVHNTNLGPALGGCRMWPFESEEAALTDALRLSKGMTYKSALAGLSLGGGKCVVIGDPRKDKSDALLRALGRFVDSLGGLYITAEDVGIKVRDVEVIGQTTAHVAGIPAKGSGDPSPATAFGVYRGILAAVKHKLGQDDLRGIRVAVQGLGNVGYHLCRYLADDGAELLVADINDASVERAVQAFDAKAAPVDKIHAQAVDVYAPCALGATINDRSLPEIQATIVAGSANNQLAEERHGKMLADAGKLYAPDYVINAGGVIYISHESPDFDEGRAFAQVARIGDTLAEIFKMAEAQGCCTAKAADRLAESRFMAPKDGTIAAE